MPLFEAIQTVMSQENLGKCEIFAFLDRDPVYPENIYEYALDIDRGDCDIKIFVTGSNGQNISKGS